METLVPLRFNPRHFASLQAQTVTGSGTTGTIPVWTGTSKLGNSKILQNGNEVFIGGMVTGYTFSVKGASGIAGYATSASGSGVEGFSTDGTGVSGSSSTNDAVSGTSGSGTGVYGASTSGIGILGGSTSNNGVKGTGTSSVGVSGQSTSGKGVWGVSSTNRGVEGDSTSKTGVVGISKTAIGVAGSSNGTTPGTSVGVFGVSAEDAGEFNGAVGISGNLAVSGNKFFRIDHPLDPANKFLTHSAIESSEVLNLYTGKVVLDGSGEALVQLPDWFEALNTDFRYQLTAIGQPGPNLYVAEEIRNNQLRIAGGTPGMKVSWQVTGVRQDKWVKAHPMQVETEKPANERGFYLQPELFGQPEEQGIVWVHHPDIMNEFKARRLAHAAESGNLIPQP